MTPLPLARRGDGELIIELDSEFLASVVPVLVRVRDQQRHLGRPVPAQLEELIAVGARVVSLAALARAGHEPSASTDQGRQSLMTVREAVVHLSGISARTLRRKARAGGVPGAVLDHGLWLIPPSALLTLQGDPRHG